MTPAKKLHGDLVAALSPLVDGQRLLAVKVYYLATSDGATLDVGVQCLANTEAELAHLATVIREETDLSALPHTEHLPTSFVRDQPTRH